jgi:hypothetical protein
MTVRIAPSFVPQQQHDQLDVASINQILSLEATFVRSTQPPRKNKHRKKIAAFPRCDPQSTIIATAVSVSQYCSAVHQVNELVKTKPQKQQILWWSIRVLLTMLQDWLTFQHDTFNVTFF